MSVAKKALPLQAAKIQKDLRGLAKPDQAILAQRYFKTGKDQYGEGDRFIGVSVPKIRQVAKTHHAIELPELLPLLNSAIHEDRLCALIILSERQKKEKDPRDRKRIFEMYLRNVHAVNNWDLVDVSAPWVVGSYLFEGKRDLLFRLAKKKSLWERRIAIVSTHYFIRQGDVKDSLRLAELLCHEPEDLMHKAVGWTLREVGKKDLPSLLKFLDRHAATLPRTLLRYSIERLPKAQQKHYMLAAKRQG